MGDPRYPKNDAAYIIMIMSLESCVNDDNIGVATAMPVVGWPLISEKNRGNNMIMILRSGVCVIRKF